MSKYKLVTTEMDGLARRLRIKAGMIEMGELIAWGSDSALMREAADALELAAPAAQGELVAEGFREIVEAVAHIGVDFGYGNFELSQEHIEKARALLEATPQPVEQQPAPDVAQLVEALDAAARSLETISRQAGIDEYMCDFLEVRGYARSRALVALEALATHRKGGDA